jgi:hypothetical protein
VAAVARYDAEIGGLHWAPQDWMCEPEVIRGSGPGRFAGTCLSVAPRTCGHARSRT